MAPAVLIPLALIWHVVVHSNARAWTQTGHTSAIGRWAGLIELVLWISVVTASVGFLLTNDGTYPLSTPQVHGESRPQ